MIWVVTDRPKSWNELAPLIRSRGYEAENHDCADHLIRQASFRPPALMVIDCGVQGSFDVVTAIREDLKTRSIPLIMFATSDNEYRQEALARGADAFVLKQSLDWAELLPEIVRLAGPPPVAKSDERQRVEG